MELLKTLVSALQRLKAGNGSWAAFHIFRRHLAHIWNLGALGNICMYYTHMLGNVHIFRGSLLSFFKYVN